MYPSGGDPTFKTTSWTMIGQAAHDPVALEVLLNQYWTPVYAFIRRRGYSEDAAADLTQAFFTAVLEDRKLLEAADQQRGRFRSFLRVAVKHFLVDEHRREHGRDGMKRLVLRINRDVLSAIEPRMCDDPSAAFDRQWAIQVLDDAIERVKNSCMSEGMETNWAIFEQRVLRPTSMGAGPAPINEMMADLGVASAQEVYSMVQTMKRKIHRELLAVVKETLLDPRDAAGELDELMHALARPV